MINSAYAQDFSGTYHLQTAEAFLTLILEQSTQGDLAGELISNTGATFQLQGMIDDGVGAGIIVGSQGRSYFEIQPQGIHLLLFLIEPDAYNQPDYSRVKQLAFERQTGGNAGAPETNQRTPTSPTLNGTGQEADLHGRLCSYSGSSSSYGNTSSSTTRWVFFDGQGRFTYGSESSFSSENGMFHSGGGQPEGSGTYRIEADNIILTFNDGTVDVASVHIRQNNGRITELMYNGTLYASGLCE